MQRPTTTNIVPKGIPKERVAICVCTRFRPVMLEKCLTSLGRMRLPKDVIPLLIVIDNDEAGSARYIFEEFAKAPTTPFACYYNKENKPGIASARNAALHTADILGADWLVFIDDDEVADRDWLWWLMVPEYRRYPILAGRRVFLPPEPKPYWWYNPSFTPAEEAPLKTAETNNVRFTMTIVRRGGLRFDERLGLGGGEDVIFFTAARRHGYEIRRTDRAVTYEVAHPARMTFKRIWHRKYSWANSEFNQRAQEGGYAWAVLCQLPLIPYEVLTGLGLFLATPLAYLIDQKFFKQVALAAARRIAFAAGRFTALFGIVPQTYTIIDGD